jgi:hypothetical protein
MYPLFFVSVLLRNSRAWVHRVIAKERSDCGNPPNVRAEFLASPSGPWHDF